ncbi:hypothetical protein IGB42_00617 [Andreprevotia sp. IGB-42]|uniref:hypothetical protein n=1 Tax=Andreprevotia sp. IGB-42 TaxID=2497473 RepID=UPI0013567D4B|nr:hypothetical protein [Andreprevotia sp. IGB-42]KAF0814563.1 hypothetical protein IGB42_00617 [Andreprevotia sp. IGB-42]
MKRICCCSVFLAAFFLPAAYAAKIPSHFSDQVEAALSCRSEWSPDYWRDYFHTYLGEPLRTWGGADWFDSQNAELAGNPAVEVFVNTRDTTALMVGALIPSPVETVRKNIEQRLGYAFVPLAGPYPRYLSKFGSVLIGLSNDQTKWYCARWNLGNRP